MSTLKRLGLGSYSGDQSLYDWLLSNFKSKHFGAEVVTYGLLTDLRGFLHLRRSRHLALNKPVLGLGDQLNGVRTS